MTLKNRGRSKKTEGRTRPKIKGGSLAVSTYVQRGSAPQARALDGEVLLMSYLKFNKCSCRPVHFTNCTCWPLQAANSGLAQVQWPVEI